MLAAKLRAAMVWSLALALSLPKAPPLVFLVFVFSTRLANISASDISGSIDRSMSVREGEGERARKQRSDGMRFSAVVEGEDGVPSSRAAAPSASGRDPFVFSLAGPDSALVEADPDPSGRGREDGDENIGGGGLLGGGYRYPAPSPRPQSKRALEKELDYYDKYRKLNTSAWFSTNARRERFNRELREVYLEETQDLKSSIFSVMDQKATYQQEISNFVVGAKRKSAQATSPQMLALGSSLQLVEEEIHRAKHQRLMEAAKQEAARQAEEQRKAIETQRKLEEERRKAAALQEEARKKKIAEAKEGRRRAAAAAAEKKEKEAAMAAAKAREEASEQCTSVSASKWEKSCAEVYQKHKAFASEIFKASKLDRLKLEKPIKKAVNQLSCSRQQIRFVGQQMIQHLCQQHAQGKPFYSYCLVRLGDLVAQQGPGLGASKQLAFAYAELVSMVSSTFNDFAYVVIAALHAKCPLTVPKLPRGYRPEQDGEIKGYVSLLAALCQLSYQEYFKSTDHSWEYVARFLNALPATEQTAIALDSFLQIAGHVAHQRFRRQQEKVFAHVRGVFIPSLVAHAAKTAAGAEGGAEDTDAVRSRIEKYVDDRLYLTPPKDSNIPETDDSQHIRC